MLRYIKKTDDYESDCLRVMQSSLHRYLTEMNYGKSIISDIKFSNCNRVLEGKARSLREQGKGKRPNASQALTAEDEKLLWEVVNI